MRPSRPGHAQQHQKLRIVEALAKYVFDLFGFGPTVTDLVYESPDLGEDYHAVAIDETADDELQPPMQW